MKKMYRVVQGQKRRNDPEKKDWVRLGIAFSDSNGMRVKLNALPLPDENGEIWLNLFEDEPKSGGQQVRGSSQQNSNSMEDSIPF